MLECNPVSNSKKKKKKIPLDDFISEIRGMARNRKRKCLQKVKFRDMKMFIFLVS